MQDWIYSSKFYSEQDKIHNEYIFKSQPSQMQTNTMNHFKEVRTEVNILGETFFFNELEILELTRTEGRDFC